MLSEREIRLKLPPGKKLEQILAWKAEDFAELSQTLGFSSTDQCRQVLEKMLTSTETVSAPPPPKKRVKEKDGKKPVTQKAETPPVSNKDIVKAGLGHFFFEDVPYDDASIEKRKDAADAAYLAAQKRYKGRMLWGALNTSTPMTRESGRMSAQRKAFRQEAMRLFREKIQSQMPWSQARSEVTYFLEMKARETDLIHVREAAYAVIREIRGADADRFDPPHAVDVKLVKGYEAVYESEAKKFVQDRMSKGKTWREARIAAIEFLEIKSVEVNLKWEGRAIDAVLRKMGLQVRKEHVPMRGLYDTLVSGGELSREEEALVASLSSRAKGILRTVKQKDMGSIELHEPAAHAVALELKRIGPGKRADAGTDFLTDASGGDGYNRSRSRPRRDMYGASGGDDDK